eukprot:PhM_4_TR5351/c0_g1_i1/m.88449
MLFGLYFLLFFVFFGPLFLLRRVGLDLNEDLTVVDRLTLLHCDLRDGTLLGGLELVAHLHGLKRDDVLTSDDLLADGGVHADDGAGHGGNHDLAHVDNLLRGHELHGLSLALGKDADVVRRAHELHREHEAVGAAAVLEVHRLSTVDANGHDGGANDPVNLVRVLADAELVGALRSHLDGLVEHDALLGGASDADVEVGALHAHTVEHLALGTHDGTSVGEELGLFSGQDVTLEAFRVPLGQVLRRELAGAVDVVVNDIAEEADVVADAADDVRIEGGGHAVETLIAVLAPRDELGDKGIVVDTDLAALQNAAVDADALNMVGLNIGRETADRGEVVVEGVLSVHTALRGPAVDLDVLLLDGEGQTRGGAEHFLDKVDAGDGLCDGVLNLETRVHLEEVEVVVAIDHHLHGTGSDVVHSAGHAGGLLTHLLAQLGRDESAGRLFDDLLVAALNGALTFGEVEDISAAVSGNLDLNVAGLVHKLLDEHAVVTERGDGLLLAQLQVLDGFSVVVGEAHTLAATTRRCLDHDGIANFIADLDAVGVVSDLTLEAGDAVDLGLVGKDLGVDLVTHGVNGFLVGADERNLVVFEGLREGGILGEETVARVHSLSASLLARIEDLVNAEVTLVAGSGANADSFVSHAHELRVLIGCGVNSHRLDAKTTARLENTAGNLTTVGDEHLVEVLLRGEGVDSAAEHFSFSLKGDVYRTNDQ